MRGPFDPASTRRPDLIVVSGLDGTGKSTQCKLLAERLRLEGHRAETIWNRWEPRLSAPLIGLAKRRLGGRERIRDEDYEGFTEAKKRTMQSRWKKGLWQLMVWSEYAFEVHHRLGWGRRGPVRICDRYVYDTVVDIAVNFSIPPGELRRLLGHPLFSLYPTPACVLFLDVDPLVGASRKTDGTPAAYLADRRGHYLELARILEAPVIDGNAAIDEVAAEILRLTDSWRRSLRDGSRLENDSGDVT